MDSSLKFIALGILLGLILRIYRFFKKRTYLKLLKKRDGLKKSEPQDVYIEDFEQDSLNILSSVEFEITNGQGVLSIGCDRDMTISIFSFKRPLSVSWYDGHGSVGQYCLNLPMSREYREKFLYLYQEGLTKDYSDNIEGLKQLLSPLFPLFENGYYELKYYYAEVTSFYPDTVDKSKEMEIFNTYRAEKKVKDYNGKERYSYGFMDVTTTNIYYSNYLFSTQPKEELDAKRIEHFKKVIKNGERPFVLVYSIYYYFNDSYSHKYILDGHHKLEAYMELGITPPIVEIFRDYSSDNNFEYYGEAKPPYNIESLKEHLYFWQYEDIVRHQSEWYKR